MLKLKSMDRKKYIGYSNWKKKRKELKIKLFSFRKGALENVCQEKDNGKIPRI